MYDLLIADALLYDGTGAPPVEGSIAIQGDRIAAVDPEVAGAARRVLKGAGLAAAPGFVDIHSHSDYHLLLAPEAESSLLQGVTLEVGGNCGYAAAPIAGPWQREREETYRETYGLRLGFSTVAEYFARLARERIGINFALLIGHNTLRGSILGGANRAPTPEEAERMAALARRGMAEGAVGLSTGLAYAPACFAKPEELTPLAAVVREAGGILTAHIRSEGDGLLEALDEILGVAEAAAIPLQISHLKTSGEKNWGKLPEAFARIEGALALGLKVRCDRYPYTAANTGLSACLPSWALEGGRDAQVARLRDPGVRERLSAELATQGKTGDFWGRVMIAEVVTKGNKRFEGMRVGAAAAAAGQVPLPFVLDLLVTEKMQVDAIYFTMSEENLRQILAKPYVMIGSDAGTRNFTGPLSGGRPHPRGFGTFPRVLGHCVRDLGLFDLATAIRKMTWDPCRMLGLADRGRLIPGAMADLTLFDPDRVKDEASYEDPYRAPSGIAWVLVNGQVAVEAGRLTGVRAGRPVSRPARREV
jgi:N-acyl-D-aspartate/D-glutamate deacylase